MDEESDANLENSLRIIRGYSGFWVLDLVFENVAPDLWGIVGVDVRERMEVASPYAIYI
jgi:hypothetical protein